MKSRFHIPTAARAAAVAVFSIILSVCCLEANAKRVKGNSYPDFAYPKTVKKNAEAALLKASASGNWATIAEAAIQLVTADNLVSRENASRGLHTIDSIANAAPENWKPAFLLIQADIYNSIYNSFRWQADERKLPLDSVPANPLDWSRDIFAGKIHDLCKAALDSKGNHDTSIKAWSSILTDTADAISCGMTVKEFIDMQCFTLLNLYCDETNDIIPFFNTASPAVTPIQKCTQLRNKAIDSLIAETERLRQPLLLAMALTDKTNCLAPSLRMKSLVSALERVKDTEGSQYILMQLRQYAGNNKIYGIYNPVAYSDREFVGMLRESVARYPKGRYSNALRNIIGEMTLPSAKIDFKNQYLSSDSIVADVTLTNCNKAYFLIYDYSPYVNAENQPKTSTMAAKCRLVKAVKTSAEGEVPFEAQTRAEIGRLPHGVYAVVPSSTPDAKGIFATVKDYSWRETFIVSDISVMSLQYPDGSTRVFVVDGANGAPIEGATVKVYTQENYREKSRLVHTLTTGKDGAVTVKEKRFEIRTSHNGSKWESDSRLYNYVQRKDTMTVSAARILTDRAICHPGDSINAAVIAFSSKDGSFSLNPNKDYSVRLLDANGKEVQTQTVTTDEYGRGAIGFKIPDHGLLGNWRLTVGKKEGNYIGETAFRVEDYVAPTFFITSDISGDEALPGDSVRISGQVLTYSGMPVGGAEVKYNVEYVPPMRWFNPGGATFDSSVTADSEGKYTITLPTANLKGTKFERGVFTLSLSATSPAGETQAGPIERFCVGREYIISIPESDASIEASADERNFTVNVLDMLGRKVTKRVNYSLTEISTGKTAGQGSFESPKLTLNVAGLASAKYRLALSLAEDSLVKDQTDMVIWRDTDKAAPAGTGLWIPRTKIKAMRGSDKAQVTIGNGAGNRWMPVVESGNDSILSFRWVYVDKDNVTLDFDAPPAGHVYKLDINSLSRLYNESATVEIEPAVSNKLEVKTLTFRDKISAGDKEKWTFRFSKDSLPTPNIPALAVMTDASLNAITPFKWNFAPADDIHRSFFSMRLYPARSITQANDLRRFNYLSYTGLSAPDINTYGQDWGLGYYSNDMVIAYGVASTYDSAAPEMLRSVKQTSRAMNKSMASAPLAGVVDEAKHEVMEETEEEAPAEAGADMGAGAAQESKETLRDSECPVAFFMPYLNADSEGVVSIDFTVPNFNTTWAMQLIGYDSELKTAKAVLEAVASKPVMVTAHSPRFVRTGDRIVLTATLFNNSGAVAPVSGRIELVDLIKGTVITVRNFEPADMEDSESRLIEMEWTVPSDLSSVGFRAYAESGNHRDGEQALLPVLPASSPVVESTPFWIAPAAESFKVQLPKFRDSDRITLQYCDNPAWYCLSALPDIVYPDSKSVTSKMLALYGNALAYNLISGNTSLKTGLEAMLSDKNPEFSALRSNLEKDGSLKITDLDNTPWVNDAASETLRMSRLSTLLDDTLANETICRLTDDIRRLQTPEGGWSWCPEMQPSSFITQGMLQYFGMLMKAGALRQLPDADPMIRKAIEYVDAETVSDYRKYHKKDESLTYLLDWLYIRSMFPEAYLSGKSSKEMSGIAAKALKDIARDWKSMGVGAKSKAAMLLWRSGMTDDASRILESLRQYASESPEKGMWFDNLSSGWDGYSTLRNTTLALEAFAEIQPQNAVVDSLRQWLVLGRQTQDWGRNTTTAETINAILTTGTDWTKSTGTTLPEITLGGKRLDLPQAAAMTGAFTMTLDAKQASKKRLTVSRSATSPAWGGVISQYESPIMEVKPTDVPDLSIRKQIVALVQGDNGELVAKEGITLSPGMKVRVTLTITAGRDMDYAAVTDERSACLEPADQLSGYRVSDGIGYYREVRDEATNLFFTRLPKGHHVISYDCFISQTGVFSCGIATIQSQYAPSVVAHTAGEVITVE